jgi:hypothetical protein
MACIASDEFIITIFEKKTVTLVFNHEKRIFGFFFVKTASMNSATGKGGGGSSAGVTLL